MGAHLYSKIVQLSHALYTYRCSVNYRTHVTLSPEIPCNDDDDDNVRALPHSTYIIHEFIHVQVQFMRIGQLHDTLKPVHKIANASRCEQYHKSIKKVLN